MGVVALLSAVALAAVFAVSGIAKLLDPGGTREAVNGFGVPPRLARLVAAGLAPAELVVALLLLVPASSPAGLVLALVLLAGFTGAVVVALRAGRRPECHCFGRIGGADISARTVVRNGVLAALAVLGLVGTAAGDRPDGSALAGAVVAGLALGAAVIALEGLAGQRARRRRDAEAEAAFAAGPAEGGQPLPEFRLPALAGGEISRDDLLAPALPLLLVSMSPGCGPCNTLRPVIAQWARVLSDRVSVAVLASGAEEANRVAYAETPHLTVLLDEPEVRREIGATSTPSAVLVGADGRLASGVAVGERLVRQLLAGALSGVAADELVAEAEGLEGVSAADLDLDSVVHPRATVETFPLEDGAVLLDTRTGATVSVDPLGALVWSVLDGTGTLGEIANDLAEVFGAPPEQVGTDLLALVRKLGEVGMFEGVVEAMPDHSGHRHDHHDDDQHHHGDEHDGAQDHEDDPDVPRQGPGEAALSTP